MTLQEVTPLGWSWARSVNYSQAVRAGDIIYTSGIAPFDEGGKIVGVGDIEAQARKVVANLGHVLRVAGISLKHIIRQEVFVRRPEDVAVFSELRSELYRPPYPASVLVVVTALAKPDMLIEIACQALAGGTQ